MKHSDHVEVRSFAEPGATRPRFGIRSGAMAAGNRLLHRHDYFEVLFFAAEASAQRIALREYVTRRGSIFFVSPMTPHQVRFEPAASCYVLYFDAAFLHPGLGDQIDIDMEMLARAPELAPFVYQRDLDFVLDAPAIQLIEAMCRRMLQETGGNRICAKEIFRANLIQLLGEVTQLYETQIRALMQERPPSGGTERHVKGVMRFIDRNLAGQATLTDAARAVAVSPNYLATLLKRETGKTFVELVTERRVERAAELLSYTALRVSQIADEAGFSEPEYFSRRFKQVTGLSPLQFREKYGVGHSAGAVAAEEDRPGNREERP
ncbi:MAG TPA: AraC family transcriptional regulator [Ramlibacter sp.]|nr:AraC family transcriptional regulator [Ramlibacter sp.]